MDGFLTKFPHERDLFPTLQASWLVRKKNFYILPAKNSAVFGTVLDVVDTVLPKENEEVQYYMQIDYPHYKLNKQVRDVVIGTFHVSGIFLFLERIIGHFSLVSTFSITTSTVNIASHASRS